MRIIGPPSSDKAGVVGRIASMTGVHYRFTSEMLDPLWDAALEYGIDPVGVVAQSAKETAWGNFPRKAQPWLFNTCGLRVKSIDRVLQVLALLVPEGVVIDPEHVLTHKEFISWRQGALGHVQHLCAYAGLPVDPDKVVDPRYELVAGKFALENFEELGGRDAQGRTEWAGSESYGAELVAIARRLQGKVAV